MTIETSPNAPGPNSELTRIKKSAFTLQTDIAEFWAGKNRSQRDAEDVHAVGLPRMSLASGAEEAYADYNCRFREAEARWFDEQGVVAYAKAVLVGPRRPELALSGPDLQSALDYLDPDQEFADALVQTHIDREPFASVSEGTHWLGEFRLLELHPRSRRRGLGVKLGTQFLQELRERYPIGFFALNAFPLQYGGDYFGSPREHLCRNEHPEQFARAREKLRQMYAEAWGATPLPGSVDYLVVPGSTVYRVKATVDGSKWRLQP